MQPREFKARMLVKVKRDMRADGEELKRDTILQVVHPPRTDTSRYFTAKKKGTSKVFRLNIESVIPI